MSHLSIPGAARTVSMLAAAGMLVGCAVPFPVYTVSSTNITTIRQAKSGLELEAFTGDYDRVSCRAQGISPEGGKSFARYIRDAINDEIIIAESSPRAKKARLALELKNIDVDCAIGTGAWIFEVIVQVGSQAPFSLTSRRAFEGSFAGALVYQRAYQAFVPSVQQLISEIMAHPSFRAETGN
jgi:hypothetical protein